MAEFEQETLEAPAFDLSKARLDGEEPVTIEDNSEESAPSDVETEDQPDAQPEDTTDPQDNVTEDAETAEGKDNPEDTSTAPGEDDDEPDADDEAFYEELSKEIGMDIKSEEDITSALKEFSQLKQNNPLESDPELKAFYEFKKSGGDTAQFHALRSKNFESMDGKNLLKEKYLLDHKDLAKEKPSLAEMRFKREMDSKYGLLNVNLDSMDEEEREEWMAENGEEFKAQKEELEYEQDKAKEALLKWQEESTSPVPQEKAELSEEDIAKIQEQWNGSIQKASTEFDGLNIKVGEGIDDFKVGLRPDETKAISEQLQNPGQYIAELTGYDPESGQVDANKLFELAAKLSKYEQMGSMLSDYVLEQRNSETIEAEATNPGQPDRQGKGYKNLSFAERTKNARHVSN